MYHLKNFIFRFFVLAVDTISATFFLFYHCFHCRGESSSHSFNCFFVLWFYVLYSHFLSLLSPTLQSSCLLFDMT